MFGTIIGAVTGNIGKIIGAGIGIVVVDIIGRAIAGGADEDYPDLPDDEPDDEPADNPTDEE